MKRPLSVSIISWYLVITGILSLGTLAMTFNDPEIAKVMAINALPVPMQYLMYAAGILIAIASGMLMLSGNKLGRLLYVSWTAFSLAVTLISSPMKMVMLPGVLVFALIVFLLYRPNANAYFEELPEAETEDDS